MQGLVQIGAARPLSVNACVPANRSSTILRLQIVTLVWMLVECGVSVYAAVTARSPAMLAFGSDSLIEVLSATVVLLQFVPRISISESTAARLASVLLFALTGVVAFLAIVSLVLKARPETSRAGIAITLAALVAMPVLAFLKRREAKRAGNVALAADAVQSATCAYLAAVALVGLSVNAIFHFAWFDSLAALAALPLLVKEARAAWQGKHCGCC